MCSLLDAVPEVRILATSREALRIGEERVHPVEGLAPDAAAGLFRERAAAADVSDADAVAEVVERLDGLPLAIELAAAKLSSVSVTELARGLRERLSLLDDGPRDAPARQRTLAAAIAWSHDLRSPVEQRVLRRLAVFPGSFDAAAAEVVAAGEGWSAPTSCPRCPDSWMRRCSPRIRLAIGC